MLTHGSLFSGIGGIDLGFERAGIETIWQCEIDEKASEVLKKHWPDVPNYKDVRSITNDGTIRIPDIISGGSPCQDVSLAGKRKGLAGERSGLWFEFARIIHEFKPKYVVFENVPGLLSSNNGKDFEFILDHFQNERYFVDCDIMDAQYFGVAQRRRRIFLICQNADYILSRKTNTSRVIILQCLIEILGSILVEARNPSITGCVNSTSLKIFSADGAMKRMKLLGIGEKDQLILLLNNLIDGFPRFLKEPTNSVIALGKVDTSQISTAGLLETIKEKMGSLSVTWNTEQLWKTILEEIYQVMKLFTTSMELKQIAELRIFIFAMGVLSIAKYMLHLRGCYQNLSTLESSILTVLKEYTNYARQASNSLFTKPEWVCVWGFFRKQAEHTDELIRDSRTIGSAKVLFDGEGVQGDTPQSREAGEGTAGTFTIRSGKEGGGKGYLGREEGAMTLGGQPQWLYQTFSGKDVFPTLLSNVGSKQWLGNQEAFSGDYYIPAYSLTLANTNRNGPWHKEELAQTLDTWGAQGVNQVGVRRLTPTECERLQGFPDQHTDGQSDTHRYQQLGNAVCVNVAEWIGKRIVESYDNYTM